MKTLQTYQTFHILLVYNIKNPLNQNIFRKFEPYQNYRNSQFCLLFPPFSPQKTYLAWVDFGRFLVSDQADIIESDGIKIISVHFISFI